MKYAFDNNWIGPTGRVIIGILTGLGLLVAGEKYIKKYFLYGQIISGGGIVILYLSFFAAYDFYHLITVLPAFFFMIIVTGTAITLSVCYNALSLMILAMTGGFLTPFLISAGKNNAAILFPYILTLDLATLIISYFKKWRQLNIFALIGTIIAFFSWSALYYTPAQLGMTMLFLTLFFLVYSISALIYNLARKENSSGTEQLLTLSSGVIYFSVSHGLLFNKYESFLGLFTLLLAIYYFYLAYVVRSLKPQDKNLYNFLAFLTIGFITLAVPIQFEKNIITILWLIEAVILVFAGLNLKNDLLKTFGIVVFVLAFTRIISFDLHHTADELPFFNAFLLILY